MNLDILYIEDEPFIGFDNKLRAEETFAVSIHWATSLKEVAAELEQTPVFPLAVCDFSFPGKDPTKNNGGAYAFQMVKAKSPDAAICFLSGTDLDIIHDELRAIGVSDDISDRYFRKCPIDLCGVLETAARAGLIPLRRDMTAPVALKTPAPNA